MEDNMKFKECDNCNNKAPVDSEGFVVWCAWCDEDFEEDEPTNELAIPVQVDEEKTEKFTYPVDLLKKEREVYETSQALMTFYLEAE